MDMIQEFVGKYSDFIMLGAGLLLITGSLMNWNWLCNPQGTPYAWSYGNSRGLRRLIFIALGAVLTVTSSWLLLKKYGVL